MLLLRCAPSLAHDGGRGAPVNGGSVAIGFYATPTYPPLPSLGGCERGPDGHTLVRTCYLGETGSLARRSRVRGVFTMAPAGRSAGTVQSAPQQQYDVHTK